ncbi:MAG: hypothetical protein V5B30_10535 [Candidatus Accumulibacter delftensis]|jgi:hypothetical protein
MPSTAAANCLLGSTPISDPTTNGLLAIGCAPQRWSPQELRSASLRRARKD